MDFEVIFFPCGFGTYPAPAPPRFGNWNLKVYHRYCSEAQLKGCYPMYAVRY